LGVSGESRTQGQLLMKVTVAICTWNRARLLDQTLSEMRKLFIPSGVDWEVLIVNNNCTDDTDDVISRYKHDLPVRRLFEPKPGLSNARNRAQDEADGGVILWTDDDVLVDQGWLAAVSGAAARYPQAAGFGGPVDPWFPVAPDPDLLAAFPCVRRGFCGVDHRIPEGPLGPDRGFVGANMAFRYDWIAGLKFNPNLGAAPHPAASESGINHGSGEESEFIDRLRGRGGELIWVPDMRVRHYVDPSRLTLSYLSDHLYEGGRHYIRHRGIPVGRCVLGVPVWVWRKWFGGLTNHHVNKLFGRRVAALSSMGHVWFHGGMIAGCWEQACRAAGQHPAPPNGVARSHQQ
jgi:glycosyltransferase involved in cell wall biosynthesis